MFSSRLRRSATWARLRRRLIENYRNRAARGRATWLDRPFSARRMGMALFMHTSILSPAWLAIDRRGAAYPVEAPRMREGIPIIMRIRVGCELSFEFPQTTPMIAMLNVHFSRCSDLERPDHLMTNPAVPVEGYRDSFGNWCTRLVAPAGRFSLRTAAIVRDSGVPDAVA